MQIVGIPKPQIIEEFVHSADQERISERIVKQGVDAPVSQVQKSLSECSSAFLRSASRRASLTGRERPHPSVSNLRVFDDVQIPEKIADHVQITQQERVPNRTEDQIVDASIPLLRRKFSRGGYCRGDPAVSVRARFRAHSCTNRRRPSASNSYSSRAVHRTLKLGIL